MNARACPGLLAALVGVLLPAAGLAAEARKGAEAALSAADVARLEKGEVLLLKETYKDAKGKMRGRGTAAVLVEKPADEAWRHLRKFDAFAEFLPRVTESKVYEKAGNRVGVAFTLKILFARIRYHCVQTLDEPNRTIRWTLDERKKNDIASTTGYWRATPHGDGKCILTYAVAVDTGRAVPKLVQDFLTRRDLPGVVRVMKKRIESGGKYKK